MKCNFCAETDPENLNGGFQCVVVSLDEPDMVLCVRCESLVRHQK